MSRAPAAPKPRKPFDAEANAERIRRLGQDDPPEEQPGRRRRGVRWTLGKVVVAGALGVLALELLAVMVLGLPLEMLGGKAVLAVPVLVVAFMMRGAR